VRTRLAAIFLLFILLASCAKPDQTPRPVPSTPVPTAGATATSTPGIPLVILVLPADLPREESSQYQTAVYDLAQANGMRYQVRNTLTPEDVQMEGPALKVVVLLPPDPGLAALVAAAPSVQFLAVNIPGLAPASNLSTVGADGAPADRQAFLAGYIAAMIADDYRVGILSMNDSQGMTAEAAFANGMHFYCGLCQKAFWTGYDYLHIEIPPDELQSRYPAYADPFVKYEASVVYVYPGVATIDLLESMAQKGLLLIGANMPAQDLQSNWVVSLKPELIPAIQRIFPELLAGRGGQTLPIPFTLADVNPGLLSEGKQRLVQQTLDDLQAGYISTGVNP
jgi:hypothetical protein